MTRPNTPDVAGPTVDDADRELHRRLATVAGHLDGVGRMISEGRSCADVAHQLSAIRGSVAALQRSVAVRHLRLCLIRQIERGDTDAAMAELVDLLVGGPRPPLILESSDNPASTAGD